ncbi:MAG TPA: glutathione S-transferase family protein [Allosphingosinicella sp.]|nr:glutathione S-transferase family protein [Allosphingosinicella sp.]
MTLRLYYHPFSSFCQKVLIALHEREVAFEPVVVDLGDADQRAALQALWPLAKFPVLCDQARALTVPESSAIILHLDQAWPGAPLVPADPDAALRAHIWDRFCDNYVMAPMQKAVADHLRPAGHGDPYGVAEAKALLDQSYKMLDAKLAEAGDGWLAGGDFSLADCAAAPALFYANIIMPFAGRRRLEAYYERLLARPSFARAVDEARPYRDLFPLEWPETYR